MLDILICKLIGAAMTMAALIIGLLRSIKTPAPRTFSFKLMYFLFGPTIMISGLILGSYNYPIWARGIMYGVILVCFAICLLRGGHKVKLNISIKFRSAVGSEPNEETKEAMAGSNLGSRMYLSESLAKEPSAPESKPSGTTQNET